jgi:hypothetical protein
MALVGVPVSEEQERATHGNRDGQRVRRRPIRNYKIVEINV